MRSLWYSTLASRVSPTLIHLTKTPPHYISPSNNTKASIFNVKSPQNNPSSHKLIDHISLSQILQRKDWHLLLNHELKAKRVQLTPQFIASVLQNQQNPFCIIRFYIWVLNIEPRFERNNKICWVLAKDDDYEPEVGSVGQHPVNCDTGHEYLSPDECNKYLGHGTDEKDPDEGEKDPEHGIGDEGFGQDHDHEDPEIGVSGGNDAPHIVASALLCLNEKHIYRDCEESFRLTVSGELHVPPEHVDEFCSGSCLDETNLVLHCIDGIMDHFVFYNKATTQDIRDTILAGCSYGDERGDFNVAEHIQADGGGENIGHKGAIKAVFGIFITLICHILLF